ncbi:MAG: glycerol-3-phosphate 1-O-acyltransferase PlsY [Lachnospiraceae bacterium]|nr:glycerol-3-phosphate 1-O-acyltransferase PlsY [Lachnospiraceae bacterium]
MYRIISLVIGYLFGVFQTGYFYGKLHGIDIRQKGSGNTGTTNSLRVLGKKAAGIVLLGDAGKTVAAILLVHFLFGNANPQIDKVLQLYAGLGATLGHNFPFYMNFKGGKGIAVLAGIYLAMGFTDSWWPFLIGLVVFFSIFFAIHYVSVASLTVSALFFVIMVVMERMGWVVVGDGTAKIEYYILPAVIMAMAFVRHRKNIHALMTGTERKTYLSKKKNKEVEQAGSK